MYILYLDETYKDKNYSLGAAFLVDSKIRKFNLDFEKEWKKLGFGPEIELHTEELWNGRGEFKNLSMDERADICKRVADFLEKSTITGFAVGSMSNIKNKEEAHLKILNDMVVWAVNFVSKKAPKSSKQLMIIFDEREDIKSKIHENLKEKYYWVIKKYKSRCHIIDYGYQGTSKQSRLLQIADFVGYFFTKRENLVREKNLLAKKDDDRKIYCLDYIFEKLKNKLKIIK